MAIEASRRSAHRWHCSHACPSIPG
jgi:hypothetical protein